MKMREKDRFSFLAMPLQKISSYFFTLMINHQIPISHEQNYFQDFQACNCFVLVLRWWCCQVSHRTVLVARPDMAGWCSNCRRHIHRRRRRCRADIEKRCGLRPPWRRRRQWRQQRMRRHRLRRAGQRRRSGEARRHDDSAFQLKSPLLPLPIVSWVLSIESATMFFLLFHVSYHWVTCATQKKDP